MGVLLPEPITEKDDTSGKEKILPSGWYNLRVDDTSQQTSSSNYTYLKIVFEIVGECPAGTFAGQKKTFFLGIYQGSEKSIGFNRALLARISRACGVEELHDTGDIEGKIFRANIVEGEWNNEPRNEIRGCSPYTASTPEASKGAPPPPVDDDDELPF